MSADVSVSRPCEPYIKSFSASPTQWRQYPVPYHSQKSPTSCGREGKAFLGASQHQDAPVGKKLVSCHANVIRHVVNYRRYVYEYVKFQYIVVTAETYVTK